ncbi:MAG: hypothetical protein ABII76_03765 [Pseudomonadota bacterium]
MGATWELLLGKLEWLSAPIGDLPQEAIATATVLFCLLILAGVAAILRLAMPSIMALTLGAIFLALQAYDVQTQWRTISFGAVALVMALIVTTSERRRGVREIRQELADMDARFDRFLDALDHRQALVEHRVEQALVVPAPPPPTQNTQNT